MARRKLISYLYPPYLFITVLAVVAVGFYASTTMREFYQSKVRENLEVRAQLVASRIREPLREAYRAAENAEQAPYDTVDELAKSLGGETDTRYTIILADGGVVGDSHEEPEEMENHADREEIREAMRERVGESFNRRSPTLGTRMTYVAVRQEVPGPGPVVVRAALPTTDIERALDSVHLNLALAALITAAVAAVVCLYAARRISQPLEEMRAGAEQFARGDFSHRLHIPDSRELAQLAETLNSMASQLDERIRTIERQRGQSQAILGSMVEGVIALDSDEQVLTINPAACQFFEVSPEWAVGRPIQEVVRNPEMQEMVTAVLTRGEPREGEFSVDTGESRHLHAYATPLQDSADREIGALFVLNDVTDLRRLEKVRSDFVANVSHELKTPITSIKGFVETLLDGALEDEDQARRFLDIVARQAERLHAIIDDLLLLSRVEQEQDLHKEPVPATSLLHEALTVCRPAAEEREISLTVDCPDDLLIPCNAPLLEQAIVNLVDNAVKYSEPGSEVQVSAGRTDSEAIIQVQDQGPGIKPDDLDRLFERFYRVDKARARKVGGTGLGLSIVKHITHVHGGRVSAESKLGKGSIFTITLPLD